MKLFLINTEEEYELKEISIVTEDENRKEIESLTKKIDVSEYDDIICCYAFITDKYTKENIESEFSKHNCNYIIPGSIRNIKRENKGSEEIITEFSTNVASAIYDNIYICYNIEEFGITFTMHHFYNGKNCKAVSAFKSDSVVLHILSDKINQINKDYEVMFNY